MNLGRTAPGIRLCLHNRAFLRKEGLSPQVLGGNMFIQMLEEHAGQLRKVRRLRLAAVRRDGARWRFRYKGDRLSWYRYT